MSHGRSHLDRSLHRVRSGLLAALVALTGVPAAADHPTLGPQEPSAQEQEGLWTLNRARNDPARYGQEIQFDLSTILPRPPLAVNRELTGSARFHAGEMLGHDYFAHVSPVTGDGPNLMAVQHGYDLFGMGLGFDWGTANQIESIAFGFNSIPDFPSALALLIVDEGVVPPGHRMHLLAMSAGYALDDEVGFGRASQGSTRYYVIHTGHRVLGQSFVTGVAYRDANGDGRYDRGEGMGGVTIQVGAASTTTLAEGGYAIAVPDGDHLVTCSSEGFGPSNAFVSVGGENVEVDCIQGLPVAEVDFAFQTNGPPGPLDVGISADADGGSAPLLANLQATGGTPQTLWIWDFGDGTGEMGATPSHSFTAPGLYPVLLRGIGPTGAGSALHLVAVSGAAGAGVGTTSPTSTTLVAGKLAAKRNLKKTGKDSVKLAAELEMPAGFVPGGQAIEVSLLGATLSFTLDEKGKARDEAGNKVKLKAKGETPLPAGVTAKLSVRLRGDLAAALEAGGLRNVTEERSVAGAPIGLLLEELAYRGAADLSVKSKAGRTSKAKLAR